MGRAYQNRKLSMAKTSDQKARVYSKYAREIYVSAKSGGLDPAGNLSLRSIIDRAKKDQVPTHVIDKAIDKAKGTGGEDFALARYEGFGPSGSMVIVDCLTDNPNRTFGDVRLCFNKAKCKLGTLMLAEVDISDIESEDGKVTIFTPHTEYFKARQAIVDEYGETEFEVDEIQFVPQSPARLSDEDQEVLDNLIDMLDYLEDVQNIYHSAT